MFYLKSFTVVFLILLCGLSAFSQGKEEIRSLGNFTEIFVNHGVTVFLSQGDKNEVMIFLKKGKTENVKTEVQNDSRLEIKLNVLKRLKMENPVVYVTYKVLNSIGVTTGAKVISEEYIQSKDFFSLDVSSSGRADLKIKAVNKIILNASTSGNINADLYTNELEILNSSSGDITLTGSVNNQTVNISTAGDYNALGLLCENIIATSTTGGTVKASASNSAKLETSTGGTIILEGTAKDIKKRTHSGGTIHVDKSTGEEEK